MPQIDPAKRKRVTRQRRKPTRLVPRHEVYLVTNGMDGTRFTKEFRATWRRIPDEATQRILHHWFHGDPVVRPQGSPLIELCHWMDAELGMAWWEGHRVSFRSSIVEEMPDKVLRNLIAHELAHVYQFASGFRSHTDVNGAACFMDVDGTLYAPFEMEEDANSRMDAWGFDCYAVENWMTETGRAKSVLDMTDEELRDAVWRDLGGL